MTAYSDRDVFAITLSRELATSQPSAMSVARLVNELCRLAKRYHHLQETACNRELSVRERTSEKNTAARIGNLLKPYGIIPVLGGDPRGCTVKLKLPSGHTDDFGGDGFCVPI